MYLFIMVCYVLIKLVCIQMSTLVSSSMVLVVLFAIGPLFEALPKASHASLSYVVKVEKNTCFLLSRPLAMLILNRQCDEFS